ncbi:MAG: alkaline phosphatase [Alphaproteobacteria bacterium]|nr:alkaline phosphatase [Alphaproteobacteria bacterium]
MKFKVLLISSVAIAIAATGSFADAPLPQANDPYFKNAEKELSARLAQKPITHKAKNIILMVGDGMGVTTTTAARIYEGQKRGVDGVSNNLTMDSLPNLALSRTYSADSQVTDSAPSASAMTTGVKSNNEVLGLTAAGKFNDCATQAANTATTIFETAEALGLATGVVTTTRITHATPAATYSHSVNRDWESDKDEGDQVGKGCKDIADQLVNWPAGDGFEVVFGGGRSKFLPADVNDPEYDSKKGERKDKRNLITEWTSKDNNHSFVFDKAGFDKIDLSSGTKVMGLFEPSHMQFEVDRPKDKAGEPSLAEMTTKAIARLKQSEKGYVLMVEGGRIDHAHHLTNASRALDETIAFDNAVKAVLDNTNREDTLVIVTADHSHTMTMSGYAKRDTPILGLVKGLDDKLTLAADGKPYTELSYANGPSALFSGIEKGATEPKPAGTRPDLTTVDTTSVDFKQPALVPLESETHGGEDVAIYASGPMAYLVSGVVDQQYIYHVMMEALGLKK